MASNVYTVTLWQITSSGPGYPMTAPPVPAGFVWVIRDVVLVAPKVPGVMSALGQAKLEVNGIPVVSSPPWGTLELSVYRWEDLRQPVLASDALTFVAVEGGWQLRVAGYQLTTP